MTDKPAQVCEHALADADASRCACTALGPGTHTKAQILAFERKNVTDHDPKLQKAELNQTTIEHIKLVDEVKRKQREATDRAIAESHRAESERRAQMQEANLAYVGHRKAQDERQKERNTIPVVYLQEQTKQPQVNTVPVV